MSKITKTPGSDRFCQPKRCIRPHPDHNLAQTPEAL